MKEKFYIFLDIDGVLFDHKYMFYALGKGLIKQDGEFDSFDPKSMQALNFLIYKLEEQFDTQLVISSARRSNFEKTKKLLYEQGLIYDKKISKTPISRNPKNRALEIIEFLKMNKCYNQNFVILDDEQFDYNMHFNPNQIIKTNIFEGSITLMHIKDYFCRNNQQIDYHIMMKNISLQNKTTQSVFENEKNN